MGLGWLGEGYTGWHGEQEDRSGYFAPVGVYFWCRQILSAATKEGTADCGLVTVLNSTPAEMFPTGSQSDTESTPRHAAVSIFPPCRPSIHFLREGPFTGVATAASNLELTFFFCFVCLLCPFPPDHQFIKCLHAAEIIRGIPRCVSIGELFTVVKEISIPGNKRKRSVLTSGTYPLDPHDEVISKSVISVDGRVLTLRVTDE